MTNTLNLPLNPMVDGIQWTLHSLEFDSAEGVSSAYMYAVSREHAEHRLEELKASGRVFGELCGITEVKGV